MGGERWRITSGGNKQVMKPALQEEEVIMVEGAKRLNDVQHVQERQSESQKEPAACLNTLSQTMILFWRGGVPFSPCPGAYTKFQR